MISIQFQNLIYLFRTKTEPIQDEEFENALTEVEKYNLAIQKNHEHERTIIFQKAKIEALQTELDGAISALNQKDLEILEISKQSKNSTTQSTKYPIPI